MVLHNTPPLQVVRGTLDALASPVQDMGINHRGFHVLMAEELLDCLIVVALSRKFVALVMFGFQTYLHHVPNNWPKQVPNCSGIPYKMGCSILHVRRIIVERLG